MSRLIKTRVEPSVAPGKRLITGDLAESWEQADETTLLFHLRGGVHFHNLPPVNGRTLAASDVVYSFTRQRAKRTNAGSLASIDRMDAVDDRTLRIGLRAPDADVLLSLADGRNKVAAREVLDLAKAPVIGTGPWIHDSVSAANNVLMIRNPDYFLQGIPFLDRIQFPRQSDGQVIGADFRAGRIDVQSSGFESVSAIDAAFRQRPNLQMFSAPALGTGTELVFRVDRPPFHNPAARRAVSAAINRSQIIDTVFFGQASLAPGFTLPGADWSLSTEELERIFVLDAAPARRLMAETGAPLVFSLAIANTGELAGAMAELVRAQLAEAGVISRTTLLSGAEFSQASQESSSFDALIGPAAPAPTTNQDLRARFRSGGERNRSRAGDPEIDALIDRQAGTWRDEAARRSLLFDLQRKLIESCLTVSIVAPSGGTSLAQAYVRNFQRFASWSTMAEYDIWTRVWLDK